MRPRLILAIVFTLVLTACGEDAIDSTVAADDATTTTATPGQNVPGSGEATIGDELFLLDPSVQCGIFPGPTVAVAGTIEGTDTEFVIDYDPANDFVEMRIGESPDDEVYWQARDGAIEFTVEGETVRGSGEFSDGQGNQASGVVEVTC